VKFFDKCSVLAVKTKVKKIHLAQKKYLRGATDKRINLISPAYSGVNKRM
jgi:hypothetical protein